jgi:hypothetical protein
MAGIAALVVLLLPATRLCLAAALLRCQQLIAEQMRDDGALWMIAAWAR